MTVIKVKSLNLDYKIKQEGNGCRLKEVVVMAKQKTAREQEKALRRTSHETGMSPWEELDRWFERAGRQTWLRPGFWDWPLQIGIAAAFGEGTPKVDILDRETEIVLRAEMPGVAKEAAEVTVSDGSVTLKAHTCHDEKEGQGEYYRREMRHGEYQRTHALPHAIDGEKARTIFSDGVLELTLPKLEKTRAKRRKLNNPSGKCAERC